MTQHAKHSRYDEHDSCSYPVNENSSEEGNDDIGEGVQCIKEVELKLSNVFPISF